jgi:hypothetical protein
MPAGPSRPSSVPSGRVGCARDAVFRSNEHFREALAEREARDAAELEAKLGRKWVPRRAGLPGTPPGLERPRGAALSRPACLDGTRCLPAAGSA